ncbi:MAG: helix-turn-helix transcriptional regulator [Pseudomonas sp.]|jgi:DNA-binding HxlR family transcriptional regulator|uniref:winged helix-turn-helix transcriptional regulator n=1 Tax=Halopseudomonas TaxID=2901189 RepID=UPI001B47BFCE|nr:helix-turn-helix transcriptional regulator [Pseudomonas sp.]MBQ0777178.1 helix-turn-helix transcriptional regulator [Pseudomonas sp.]WOD10549.1 helix-turn-helix domain-containing protein [Pseudomonas sp. NyZ704]|tara:strand:- start:1110 stop:1595 length:486 start_codon:yes stop_codon:yes gene_type:complete
MLRATPHHDDCSVTKALDIIGDWWALLILRNAFHGMRTFDALQKQLGISTSVLSSRLKTMTEAGVLKKVPATGDGRSFEYRLTPSGHDLYPVLVALMQWGEKWRPNEKGQRLLLLEKATGLPVQGVEVLSAAGLPLKPWDVVPVAGPGADERVRELIGSAG